MTSKEPSGWLGQFDRSVWLYVNKWIGVDKKSLRVYWNNSTHLGEIVKDVDGYYMYFPRRDTGGGWDGLLLRMLADMLDELNKPWDDEVKTGLQEAGYGE